VFKMRSVLSTKNEEMKYEFVIDAKNTFYEHPSCQYSCAKKFQSQNVTRGILQKTLTSLKGAHKMFMKLTPAKSRQTELNSVLWVVEGEG